MKDVLLFSSVVCLIINFIYIIILESKISRLYSDNVNLSKMIYGESNEYEE